MIPSAANSDYPRFVADQVLTSDNLNDLFGYLDEQGRMTRTNLIGMGIVCGLQVKAAADGSSITISKGVGVTSAGYLVSVPEITYSKRGVNIFDALKCEQYSQFVDLATSTQKFNLWELKQEAEEQGTIALTKTFLTDGEKIVLLFVELLEENNKNCEPDSCDDKGITVTVNFRPLLVAKADVDSFLSNDSNTTGVGNAMRLPEYKMPRYDVPATLLLDTEDILSAYQSILNQNFINGFKKGIGEAYDKLKPLLEDDFPATTTGSFLTDSFNDLAFLYNGSLSQQQAIHLQYYYDFFSDLAQAYDELRRKAFDSVCECLPDESLFPRHLLLGEAIGFVEQQSMYRTRFMSSPVLCCCADDKHAIKLLFKKILLLIKNFSVPSIENNPNRKGIPVRITPSTLGSVPLSEKAIPYYYTVNKGDDPLYLGWSAERRARQTENQVLSYHATDYNNVDEHVTQPLKFELEPNNFLRIEGHIGRDYKTVIKEIEKIRKAARLPFEMLALSSDTRGIFSVLTALRNMDTTGSIAQALTEMLKHPCCFADIFLALDQWVNKLRCCLAEQKRFYMAQPSFENRTALNAETSIRTNVAAAANFSTIGEVYEAKRAAGTINNQFCSDVFVNIATNKALPGQGLIMMPYKIDRVLDILPDHISKLDAMELEARTADLGSTATNMRTMYASPNVAGTMTGVNLPELQSRLQMNCMTCLLMELRLLIREFLLRLLALMIRQKFGFYAYKNPGIQHKAGVPMGGTFILVYHEQTERASTSIATGRDNFTAVARPAADTATANTARRSAATSVATNKPATGNTLYSGDQPLLSSALLQEEFNFLQQVMAIKESPNQVLDPLIADLNIGTVIADFYVPYLCCSDCPPAQMIVLAEPIIANQPPVARPGDNISIALPQDKVVLDGGSSSDPDGIIDVYLWEQATGNPAKIETPNQSKTQVAELKEGDYEFKLTVTDNKGAQDSAMVSIKVLPKTNTPPIAKAFAQPAVVVLNVDEFGVSTLDGSGSTDPDGEIEAYKWLQTSGPGGAIIKPDDKEKAEVQFRKPGIYIFELTVTDNNGATDSTKVTVTVNTRANQPPVAKAVADPAVVVLSPNGAGRAKLSSAGSFDPDGDAITFNWSLPAGSTGAEIKPTQGETTEIIFSKPGEYQVTLTVTDSKGAKAVATVIVTVTTPANQGPVARAVAMPPRLILVPNQQFTVELDGSSSTDPDGDIVSFKWTGSGATAGAAILSPDSKKTTVQFFSAGNYTFLLTVTDNAGRTATTTVPVVVVQETVAPKTCSALTGVIAGFNALETADTPLNLRLFMRLYIDLREITAFYKLMESAAVASMSVNNQVKFFTEQKIETRLVSWVDNLRPVIQESFDCRLLALLMLRIHSNLSYYISCIQKDDIDKADVKMMHAQRSVSAILKAIQPMVPNFTPAHRNVLSIMSSETKQETNRLKNNNEEAAKANYAKVLKSIIELLG